MVGMMAIGDINCLRSRFYRGFMLLMLFAEVSQTAHIAISIPENLREKASSYRLDYSPGIGSPPPNTIMNVAEIPDVIMVDDALPGMKYEFRLFYNDGPRNRIAWADQITTAPDPPTNLTVMVEDGVVATATWTPPAAGNYSKFKLKLQNFDSTGRKVTNIVLSDTSYYTFYDLVPGTEYSLEVFSVADNVDSFIYAKTKFLTNT